MHFRTWPSSSTLWILALNSGWQQAPMLIESSYCSTVYVRLLNFCIIFKDVLVCEPMSMYTRVQVLMKVTGLRSPGDGLTYILFISAGCEHWEMNSGPLEEQVLLTTEPSVQSLYFNFLKHG